MDCGQALDFVREHGVVLVSASGPAPKLTEAIAGEKIKGSWWGHPKASRFFPCWRTCASMPMCWCAA